VKGIFQKKPEIKDWIYTVWWETDGMLMRFEYTAWYPSGKEITVVRGAKSAEINGAYHWFFIACCAEANENAGVVRVVVPAFWDTVANEGMITSADDVSALTTVTCRLRFCSRAFWRRVAGFAAWKKIAACSVNERSYCISACAFPFPSRVTVSVFAVNACAGMTARHTTQRHPIRR